MVTTLMVLQAVVSVILILLVLVQFGKGAEAGLFTGPDSVITGGQQGGILRKITIGVCIVFFANSLYLARLQSHHTEATIFDGDTTTKQESPVTPTTPASSEAPVSSADQTAADATKAPTAQAAPVTPATPVATPTPVPTKK